MSHDLGVSGDRSAPDAAGVGRTDPSGEGRGAERADERERAEGTEGAGASDRPPVSRRTALKAFGALGATAGGASIETVAQRDGTSDSPQEDAPGASTARAATIRLDAVGDYDYPDAGRADAGRADAWRGGGSGFLVSPDGVAVTANHAVNGADELAAYVGEDRETAYPVTVLGRSDCSDLAVVELDGAGFPALDFRPEPVSPGERVSAHGFPTGMPLSSTFGRVSATGVDGHTGWTSIPTVLSHSADVAFGSAGGPLVDDDGRAVGVNCAGGGGSGASLTIDAAVAARAIVGLRRGDGVGYFGVSGAAVETETPMTADGVDRAIHVVSVESGSAASAVGLEPGDRVLRLGGSPAVAPRSEEPFPTKRSYCATLRSGAGGGFPVRVHREQFDGSTVLLEGRVGGEPLTVVGDGTGSGSYSFRQVSSGAGTISTEIPTEWTDVRSGEVADGPYLAAAPDVNAFLETWAVPGAFVVASDRQGADVEAVLDRLALDTCGTGTRSVISNGQFTGRSDRFDDCPESATTVTFAAVPDDRSFVVYGLVQLVDDRDEEALARFLGSLSVQNFGGGAGGGSGGTGGGGASNGSEGGGGASNGSEGGNGTGGNGGAADVRRFAERLRSG